MNGSATPVAPHVSVVLCTRNRHDKIGKAVASLLQLDYPSFDVTVIDQSTTDETGAVLEPMAAADPKLHYFHVDEAGLSRAYNSGIAASIGEILAFTDDDCVVEADWLRHIVAAFQTEPDGMLLYGRVVPFGETAEDAALTPTIDITEPSKISREHGFKVFGMGANYAARRALFDRIGGFDVVLGGGGPLRSSQDFDLAYRTWRAGLVTLLRPEVVVRHDGRREIEDWPSLLSAYGTGDGAFVTKHVRCRDPHSVRLVWERFAFPAAKWVVKVITRRGDRQTAYFKGFLSGVRGSFRYRVDREARLYVEG